ncbi:MAG TPA: glycosyltransferase family 2 protein [Clostridia bacterium]|nr:glycosyltransferase family 2 protein [Clostridia bacterium]
MSPLVSVVIPTYKRGGDFLRRAIHSVLNQTYSPVEVVVVDDNPPESTDRAETENTMGDFSEHDALVYLKNAQNMGGGLARNRGIAQAGGDYVTFLDDDDIYLPEKIESQIRFMLEGDFDLSLTGVRIHGADDTILDCRMHPYIKDFSNEELLKLHIMHHLTPTASYMFKKDALIGIGGFDDVKAGQEFLLMLKAIENGLKIGYLPVAHLVQYVHEGERITTGRNKIKGEMELFGIKKQYLDRLGPREQRYVRFQHHALMMVLGKRTGSWGFALRHFSMMVLSSPLDCVLRGIHHFRNPDRFRDIPGG